MHTRALALALVVVAAPWHARGDEPDPCEAPSEPWKTWDWYVNENHHYLPPPLADVNAPLNYFRAYYARPTQYTVVDGDKRFPWRLDEEADLFFDVGFGEEFIVGGVDFPHERFEARPPGVALFIDGDMHMLLDDTAVSSAVIDSDFRLGVGLQGRGVPPIGRWYQGGLRHFAWRLKVQHESDHIGDEFLEFASARKRGGEPRFADFVRVNVSFESVEATIAADWWASTDPARPTIPVLPVPPFGALKYVRGYVTYRGLLSGPWTLDSDVTRPGRQYEMQLGFDGRLLPSPAILALCKDRGTIGRAHCPRHAVVGAELFWREQYRYNNPPWDAPRRLSLNVVYGGEWGDYDGGQMVFRLLASYYSGINPHGQFRAEPLSYFGITAQADF